MKKSDASLWDTFSYLTTQQKKSIIELTNSYETPIICKPKPSSDSKIVKEKLEHIKLPLKTINVPVNDLNKKLQEVYLCKETLEKQLKGAIDTIQSVENIRDNIKEIYTAKQILIANNQLSINLMNDKRNYAFFLEQFTRKLSEIEKLKSLKIRPSDIISLKPSLDKIDYLWAYIRKYPNFKDFEHYSTILTNKRGEILNELFVALQTILINASSSTVEFLRNQTQVSYHLIVHNFRLVSSEFSANFRNLPSRISNHPQYQSVLERISEEYINLRLGLIKGIINSSFQQFSISTIDVEHFRITFLLFIRILNDESQLFISYFESYLDELDAYLKTINLFFFDTVCPHLVKVSDISLICQFISLINNEIICTQYSDYIWWKSFLEILTEFISQMQSRISYLAQKFIDNHIEKFSTLYDDRTSRILLEHTFQLLDELFISLSKSLFEKIAQQIVDSILQHYENIKIEQASSDETIKRYIFVIKNLLGIREKLTTFDVNFISKDIVLDFGDLIKAANVLLQNKSSIFSLNSNNALLTFFLMGAPKLCEKWIDSKKDIELKIRNYCFGFVGYCTNMLSNLMIKTIESLNSHVDEESNIDIDNIVNNLKEIFSILRLKSPHILKLMHQALGDPETEKILFKPIKANVVEKYKILYHILEKYFDKNEELKVSLIAVEEYHKSLHSRKMKYHLWSKPACFYNSWRIHND